MARLKFRVTGILLDEEEDVAVVAACVDNDAYEVITGILGEVNTMDTRRGGTEMAISLPVTDALKLFGECGRMNGHDPRYAKGSSEIYDSLSAIVYGLIED